MQHLKEVLLQDTMQWQVQYNDTINELHFSILFWFLDDAKPSCTKNQDLITEGYEEVGDKYYKLYHGADKQDQYGASTKCQSVGARLATLKTQNDFDIASSYRGENTFIKHLHDYDGQNSFKNIKILFSQNICPYVGWFAQQ